MIALRALILSAIATLSLAVQPASARPPNIIFIMADDLGYGDIGPYGQTKIRTPYLDQMAAEGMRFTQMYAGNAVCAPSRSVLMTGLHPGHTYTRDNLGVGASAEKRIGRPSVEGQYAIPGTAYTVAAALKAEGYRTGGFGKWGLGGPRTTGDPLKQGFDRFFGYNDQTVAHNYYPTYLWDNDTIRDLKNQPFSSEDKLTAREDPGKASTYRRFIGTEYSADLIGEEALKFVRANRGNPFFLYWPTTVPHVALQVPADSLAEYLGNWDDPPYPGGKGYLPCFAPKATYAAMITRMDRDIGRMMQLIVELGLDQDTVFVFTSDNGPLTGKHQGLAGTDGEFFNSNGGFRDGKGSLYEGGIRVPAIVRWKGRIRPNSVNTRIAAFEDWFPTLLDLIGAGARIPKSLDGISFAPSLFGKKQPERAFVYREFPSYGGQQSLRIGNWKGIRRNLMAKGKIDYSIELYDLAKDPGETKNIATEHPDVIAKMERIMREQHTNSADFPFPALDNIKG